MERCDTSRGAWKILRGAGEPFCISTYLKTRDLAYLFLGGLGGATSPPGPLSYVPVYFASGRTKWKPYSVFLSVLSFLKIKSYSASAHGSYHGHTNLGCHLYRDFHCNVYHVGL